MARERRPPSARPRNSADKKQEKDAAETRDHDEHPATKKDVNSHATAPSASDEPLKHDENQQSSSSEVTDTRTFQQLVHDYGDDSKWRPLLHSIVCTRPSRRQPLTCNVVLSLNELFHAQPSDSNVELNTETDEGK